MKQLDANFFPGWVRKCISFTIDDGNVRLDRKFLDITEPAGLKGTFNLNTPLKRLDADGYRDFYRGYEIANHCQYHAYGFTSETTREIKNEPFDRETADKSCLYPAEEGEGLYRVYTYNWCYVAKNDTYLQCTRAATEELENVFGKGTVKDYVWPCGEQKNAALIEKLKVEGGFRSIRKTGCIGADSGFAMPADRLAWSYNANNQNLTEFSKAYKEYPDDGKLKFFCFGVHSHDFENADNWYVLEDFCRDFGNRPNNYWYASVGEIFDYEDAVKALQITDTEIKNDSPIDLYVKIDGEPIVLLAHSAYALNS